MRDHYTCQFCGFQAGVAQEVINKDNNYSNNKMENMVTACVFCSQCFFIESVGVGDYGGGSLIYLPEMDQARLNSLCHVLFCAITNDSGYKSMAQDIYRSLRGRIDMVEKKFGEGTSDPAIFGQLLIDINKNKKNTRSDIFKNICLLPARAKFRKQIEQWAVLALEQVSQ